MAAKTAFENGQISNFEGLVTLTLDQVILHTVMHHSSTSTYLPNFTKRTDGHMYTRTYLRMYVHMDRRNLRPALLGRLSQTIHLKSKHASIISAHRSIKAPHHSIFYKPDALPHTYPTVSRHGIQYHTNFITTVLLFHYHLPVV